MDVKPPSKYRLNALEWLILIMLTAYSVYLFVK